MGRELSLYKFSTAGKDCSARSDRLTDDTCNAIVSARFAEVVLYSLYERSGGML